MALVASKPVVMPGAVPVLTSYNWCGVADVANATAAQGQWNVPAVVCRKLNGPGINVSFVGVGGMNGSLVQCGTGEEVNNGSVAYFAWYEWVGSGGDPTVDIQPITSMIVMPGDRMWAEVVPNGGGYYTMNITDLTEFALLPRRLKGNEVASIESPQMLNMGTTAEVIPMEAVTFGNTIGPLPAVSPIVVTCAEVTENNGPWVPIGCSSGPTIIQMQNPNGQTAETLGLLGGAFVTEWLHS
jgi:hypothetical protein